MNIHIAEVKYSSSQMTVAFGKKRIFSLSFHLFHTLYERLFQRKNNFSPHIYYLPDLSKKTVFSLSFHLLHTFYERLLQRKNNFSPLIYYLPNLSKKTVFSLSCFIFLVLFFLFKLFLAISCTSIDSSQYRFSGHLRH